MASRGPNGGSLTAHAPGGAHDRCRVLVVDDDPSLRTLLTVALDKWGATVESASGGDQALEAARRAHFDVVITDVKMPQMDGHELLRRLRVISPDTDVLMVTAYGTIDSAVRAMREGASDYVTKPFSIEELHMRLARILGHRRLRDENRELRSELRMTFDVSQGARLVGSSKEMRDVYEAIRAVAGNRSNVLLQGETGTGKELVARAIHYSGPRAEHPFVALNCGSVSKTLLESQLFGHVRGAFTGAVKDTPGFFVAASGGTLFLDEVTEVDSEIQVKLLRAIQEREVTPVGGTAPRPVDVRIVAATNRDAQQAVKDGILRQDLYYRLSVVVIALPPLRERRADIPELVAHFNNRLSEEYGLAPREISPAAMDILQRHDWAGNVRELENVIERAFALGTGTRIEPEQLPAGLRGGTPTQHACAPGELPTLRSSQEELVRRALRDSGGNKSMAARKLGIDRKRLYRMIRRCGLSSAAKPVPPNTSGAQT